MDFLAALPSILISNAVVATLLAGVVFGLTRFVRQPHVVYALWFIVLLKLVTPPLVPLEIPRLLSLGSNSRSTEQHVRHRAHSSFAERHDETLDDEGNVPSNAPLVATTRTNEEIPTSVPATGPVQPIASHATPDEPALAVAVSASPPPASLAVLWRGICLAWIIGSLVWLLTALVRMFRFDRTVRQAPLASTALRRESETIARRFDLPRPPELRTHAGQLPPILWALGRLPRVLLPEALLARLDPAQRRTLLAHEFAHLRRRDHRTRWLELIVLTLYWWHPVAWWARSRLQEAEEQCCDASVLQEYPERAHDYAETLLATMDFLSETRTKPPLIASGFGQGKLLRRRFEMILGNQPGRKLSKRARLALLGTAMLVLPLAPLSSEEVHDTEEVVITSQDGSSKKFQVDSKTAQHLERIIEGAIAQGHAHEEEVRDRRYATSAPVVGGISAGDRFAPRTLDRLTGVNGKRVVGPDYGSNPEASDSMKADPIQSEALKAYVQALVRSALEEHKRPRAPGSRVYEWRSQNDQRVNVTDPGGRWFEFDAKGKARSLAPYVVRAGDSVYSIATRHGTTVEKILSYNNLEDPHLEPGQKLQVPSKVGSYARLHGRTTNSQGSSANAPPVRRFAPLGSRPGSGGGAAPRWPSRHDGQDETAPDPVQPHAKGQSRGGPKDLERVIREAVENALRNSRKEWGSRGLYYRALENAAPRTQGQRGLNSQGQLPGGGSSPTAPRSGQNSDDKNGQAPHRKDSSSAPEPVRDFFKKVTNPMK